MGNPYDPTSMENLIGIRLDELLQNNRVFILSKGKYARGYHEDCLNRMGDSLTFFVERSRNISFPLSILVKGIGEDFLISNLPVNGLIYESKGLVITQPIFFPGGIGLWEGKYEFRNQVLEDRLPKSVKVDFKGGWDSMDHLKPKEARSEVVFDKKGYPILSKTIIKYE